MAIYRDEQGNIISRKSPVSVNGKQTEAQKKAQRKYLNKLRNDKKFQFSVTIDRCFKKQIEDYNIIHDCDKTKLFINMLNYCINGNSDFDNYLDNQIKSIENNINLTEYTPIINTDNLSIDDDSTQD